MSATSANCRADQLLEGEVTAPRRVEALLEVINHEKTEKVLKLLEKQLNHDDPKRKLKLANGDGLGGTFITVESVIMSMYD